MEEQEQQKKLKVHMCGAMPCNVAVMVDDDCARVNAFTRWSTEDGLPEPIVTDFYLQGIRYCPYCGSHVYGGDE